MMDMDEYQRSACSFAVYKDGLYPFFGLAEEAGEVMGKIAKLKRGDHGEFAANETHLFIYSDEKLAKELGDCLWMIANCAKEMGFDLSDIAQTNIDKLTDRKERQKIKGEGDER